VTGTFLLTTTLFLVQAEAAWGWSRWRLALVGALFGLLELTFFSANLTKIIHGGWLPIIIAILVATTMLTWRKGAAIVTRKRRNLEGPLADFLEDLHTDSYARVPGTAVFMHPGEDTAPLALRENLKINHVVHQRIAIVRTVSEVVPHVAPDDRIRWRTVGEPRDRIIHLDLHYGFQDDQNVPRALEFAAGQGVPIDPGDAVYFLSRITIQRGPTRYMRPWRKRLFIGLAHNAASPTDYFRLPSSRTVSMGAAVTL
jgi:KUP system potassium uptake protein